MNLSKLPKTTTRGKKRLGQGYGSGKGGHTSSRGAKGDLARGGVAIWFEGGQLPTIRRFPFIKGKARFKSLNIKPLTITLTQLNSFSDAATVDFKALVDKGFAKNRDLKFRPIKIVSQGKLEKKLTINLPATKKAITKIEAVGGKVVRESAA